MNELTDLMLKKWGFKCGKCKTPCGNEFDEAMKKKAPCQFDCPECGENLFIKETDCIDGSADKAYFERLQKFAEGLTNE